MAAPLPRIHLPLLRPEDVIPHLGKPTHWKEGRSAKAVAESWFRANDLPPAVRAVLDQSEEYRGAELIDAWLERCVDLGDGQRPTQTDLMAVLGIGDELAVVAVEAKVDESFGPTVAEWLVGASEAKLRRLAYLAGLFGLDPAACGPLRYQFLHRTASALLEAQRYRAKWAVMLVQSFCPKASGFEDYAAFCEAVGLGRAKVGVLSELMIAGDLPIKLGWIADRLSNWCTVTVIHCHRNPTAICYLISCFLLIITRCDPSKFLRGQVRVDRSDFFRFRNRLFNNKIDELK